VDHRHQLRLALGVAVVLAQMVSLEQVQQLETGVQGQRHRLLVHLSLMLEVVVVVLMEVVVQVVPVVVVLEVLEMQQPVL